MQTPEKLNIVIASDVFPPRCGGSGWSSFYLARALADRGHNVQVVIPKEGKAPGTEQRIYEGLPVTEYIYTASKIPFVRNFTRNERFYPRFANWLEGFFRKHNIQVAHGQHYLTIPPVVMAAQRTGAVSLGTIRDYWPVCYWTTHLSGESVCPGCSPINRVKCLYKNQGPAGIPAAPVSLYMASNLRLKQRWLAKADAVLTVSHYVAGKLTGFVPPERLQVLPTFVDFDQLDGWYKLYNAQDPGMEKIPNKPHLLFIGKLEANKGANLLIDILKEARPDMVTLVAGDGSLREQMEEQARLENLDVKFLGWTAHDEVMKLIAQSEALLFPSLWPEPLSRVLLESAGLGALIVAIDTGGTPDLIRDGENGLLARDASGTAQKLKAILQPGQADTRLKLREAARQTVKNRYSREVVVAQTEALYRRLMAQKQHRAGV